ncbi:hypothetical protein [Aquibacillus rhizosphaerae]|uniref:Alpha/beta hydrolase fold-3 domain-containing protein n=1 Tax=Aquibacillus rhizosphaerae TaxID=3051431 RepID=A0ABT7L893_9BACI|nr:hypothetical protein [Aquibacillus sp. LR5S19]MDL4842071.1 hypothetical protein [Aquibacillus sp. LR5S19]
MENNNRFNAEAVFISGTSAGGQVANVVGLGLVGWEYGDILNPDLKVKGIIPVFSTNGASNVGIDRG